MQREQRLAELSRGDLEQTFEVLPRQRDFFGVFAARWQTELSFDGRHVAAALTQQLHQARWHP